MNSHTKLLALLDEVFGPDDKLKSSFRKVSQDYDERTDEHVVLIEYRVREQGTLRIPADAGHCFRRKPVTDSGPCRSPIPEYAGRGVTRVNPATVFPFSSGKGMDGGTSEVTRAQDTRDIAA